MTSKAPTGMYSMTGFAAAEASADGVTVRVALRSVNHRHLDVRLHLPDSLRDSDDLWTPRIREQVRRGRVEASVQVERSVDSEELTFDRDVVRRLAGQVDELRQQGLVTGGLTGGDLLLWGQALGAQTEPDDQESVLAAVERCLDEALTQLVDARRQEGNRLAEFLLERLGRVEALAAEMIDRRGEVEAQLKDEYRRRLVELGAPEQLSEERLALEVAAAIDKASITEETDRLVAHCEHFRAEAGSGRASGRKLDFIVQEAFRELNTIAAKARDSALVHLAIEGKTVCEDLREQLRNVE